MELGVKGLRLVVAGGSRGIGRAIAMAFAGAGADVSICARGAEALASTRAELAATGVQAHAAACDLARADEIARYVGEAAAALGGIDVLVNNATGVADAGDAWRNCLEVDLMAAVHASEAARPHLEASQQRRGMPACIVNTSSISGLMPATGDAAYAAAKAALIQFTTSQALMLAPRIRVNCVAPGSIDFPGGYWDRCKRDDPEQYRSVLKSIPMGRYGRPEEIAKVVLFLASDLGSWVTGHTIVADGGQMLTR